MSRLVAIVPVKALAIAKGRLACVLPPVARWRLVLRMLDDVLTLLARADGIERVLVVTPDAEVANFARERGAAVLREDASSGLNSALHAGLGYAQAHGFDRALIVPADVPLATAEEIASVVGPDAAGLRPQAVVVPSHDGVGTSALLLSPPDALQPAFGIDSFVRHVAEAVALGLDLRVLRLPGLAADVDEPADLARLLEATRGSGRYDFLAEELRTAASTAQPEKNA